MVVLINIGSIYKYKIISRITSIIICHTFLAKYLLIYSFSIICKYYNQIQKMFRQKGITDYNILPSWPTYRK